MQELAPAFGAGRIHPAPGDEVEGRMRIVHRHMQDGDIVHVVRGDLHRIGRDEQGRAHIVMGGGVVDGPPDRRIAETEGGAVHEEARRLVGGGAQPVVVIGLGAIDAGGQHVGGMQRGGMGGVDGAFQNLRPVAIHDHLGNGDAGVRSRLEHRRIEGGHLVGGAHVDPDETSGLMGGIGLLLHLFLEGALAGLGGHVDRIAVHIELPAVIEAAQPAFLVAAKGQRGLAVGAEFVEHAHAPIGIAEGHEILAQQPDLDGIAIGLGDLLGQTGREPVPTHDPAHGRVAGDAGQDGVFLFGQHGLLLQVCAITS